jgi:hypothetical protein
VVIVVVVVVVVGGGTIGGGQRHWRRLHYLVVADAGEGGMERTQVHDLSSH